MRAVPEARRYRRSPFLVLLWSGGELELLHADTLRRFRVHPSLIPLLSRLSDWSSADDLEAAGWPAGAGLAELHGLGLLQAEDEAAAQGSAPLLWDPLELAVQRRTAWGGARPDPEAAGSPPELRRPDRGSAMTALPPPAPRLEVPLSDALDRRRTVRSYAARALRLDELSTLLYHAARVVRVFRHPRFGEGALRPFPTAGARSELEIYVVGGEIAGLSPGAHHYDPHGHRLLLVRERDGHQERLLRSVHAAAGGGLNRDPACILLITAVFERTMWKYHDLGLSLVYKDAGALFQTLYLVATALGLAPCALGAGEEAENSRWLGLDPLRESQVGCFLIGPAAEGGT